MHFDKDDWVYLKLGSGYDVEANKILPRKLRQRFVGRFKVLERVGSLAYKLDLPSSWLRKGIHPVVSVAHLEPAPAGDDPWDRQAQDVHLPTFDPRFPDDTDRYDVEAILAMEERPARGRPRRDGSRRMVKRYLVRWAGQTAKEDEWLTKDDLVGCEELLNEFENKLKEKETAKGARE